MAPSRCGVVRTALLWAVVLVACALLGAELVLRLAEALPSMLPPASGPQRAGRDRLRNQSR